MGALLEFACWGNGPSTQENPKHIMGLSHEGHGLWLTAFLYRRQAHRDKSYDGEQTPISFGTLHTREAGWLRARAPAEARGVKRVAHPNRVASLALPRYRDACSATPSGANGVAVDRPADAWCRWAGHHAHHVQAERTDGIRRPARHVHHILLDRIAKPA